MSQQFEAPVKEAQAPTVDDQGEIEEAILVGLIALPGLASKIVSSTRPEDYQFGLHRDFAKVVYPILTEGSHADLLVFKAKLPAPKSDDPSHVLVYRDALIAFATKVFASTGDAVTPGKVEAYLPIFMERAKKGVRLYKRFSLGMWIVIASPLLALVWVAIDRSESARETGLGVLFVWLALVVSAIAGAILKVTWPHDAAGKPVPLWARLWPHDAAGKPVPLWARLWPHDGAGKPVPLLVRLGVTCPQCGRRFTMRSHVTWDTAKTITVYGQISRYKPYPTTEEGHFKKETIKYGSPDGLRGLSLEEHGRLEEEMRSFGGRSEYIRRHSGSIERVCSSCGYATEWNFGYVTN